MLMPRYSDTDNHSHASSTTTTVAAHTKMRLLSKVEHNMRQNQQQSINKLIHTAATGNGLVGDVDELLMPMRAKNEPGESFSAGNSVGSSKEASHCRPERNLWSRAEMLEMLNIMQQMNALDQLNDRNVKSEHVFRQIEDVMRSKGYVKKSSIQIWTKWKFLKSTYNTTTRHGNGIPKVVPEEVYRVLCRMLSNHSSGNSSSINGAIGSECGNSMDSSNAELRKTADDANDELEHPIFGFRLGLVKAEPLDTGYENNLNSSEQEMEAVDFVQNGVPQMEHTPFMVTVKHEPEMDLGMDGTNTPPPTAPTSPSPPPSANYTSPATLSSSVSSSTFTPLRVASFASSSTPTHGVLHIERPASMMHHNKMGLTPALLPGKLNRTMPLQSTSSINFVHPTSKLMLPRKQQLHRELRLPREISLQPTAAATAAPATRPLKAMPMRETGYSLRPDRVIPDLEQSISPPQSPSPPMQQSLPKYAAPMQQSAYPSTSRHAQQMHNELLNPLRKRRLNLPQQQQQSPVPVKLQRSSTLYSNKPHSSVRSVEDTPASAEEPRQQQKVVAEELQRRKREQQEEFFKRELHELANGFRDAQKEMLEDFFQHQKQLARRQHEFQLKQDNLVMTALRKQTDALLNMARQLQKPAQPKEMPQEESQQEEARDEDLQQEEEDELQEQEEQRETETNLSNKLGQPEQELEEYMEEDDAEEDDVEEEEGIAQYSDEEEEEDMQSEDDLQM
ncbi:hypothetical protein KR044_003618, partial [Drosophila immigrans]